MSLSASIFGKIFTPSNIIATVVLTALLAISYFTVEYLAKRQSLKRLSKLKGAGKTIRVKDAVTLEGRIIGIDKNEFTLQTSEGKTVKIPLDKEKNII